jgi:hypothetical protein
LTAAVPQASAAGVRAGRDPNPATARPISAISSPMKDRITPHDVAAHEQLTASVQALTLPKGLYTFSVRSADPERAAELGGLMLPALHVGPGPNVPAAGIEFLSDDDGGHWLYAAGDMLVAKIVDRPVTLLLTSVRAAGSSRSISGRSARLIRRAPPADGDAASPALKRAGERDRSGGAAANLGACQQPRRCRLHRHRLGSRLGATSSRLFGDPARPSRGV